MTITDRRSGSASASTARSRLGGIPDGLCCKAPVLVATAGNITLNGLQTIDGVSVTAGARVLVKDQSIGSQNGIYDAATGNWTRSVDAAISGSIVEGTHVYVNRGSLGADTDWVVTTDDDITIGTTAIVFARTATSVGVTQVEITAAGPYTVTTERIILVNQSVAAAITLRLPACATRSGFDLVVIDKKGDAATNNITITPNGVETINSNASDAIAINKGAKRYLPMASGGWRISA